MKFEIKNNFTANVQFSCELSAEIAESSYALRLGFAVKKAIEAGANLARANLAGAYLARAYLARANLAGANLADACLADANLAGANLVDANLVDANLAGANLVDANLAGANLVDANLAGAYLAGANLAGAYLAGANLADVNLARAYLAGACLARTNVIDGGLRSDGFRFFLLREGDKIVISAGCRRFSIADARAHWIATRANTRLGNESLALVDHMERMARIAGWLDANEKPAEHELADAEAAP
jgi:hypothetical protein